MNRLAVTLPGLNLKNPIMPASGTFGFGKEMSTCYDLNILGAIVSKSVTQFPKQGNPTPRIAETTSGLINSIGLQNPGLDSFIKEHIPFLEKQNTPTLVNVAGANEQEYIEVCRTLDKFACISAIELNVSCPNVSCGGMAFGQDPEVLYRLITEVKKVTQKPLYIKLSPNVTSIQEIVKVCDQAGADGICMINTLKGLRLDLNTKKPIIKRGVAGLSGPAIKSVALALVYEARQVTDLPIIGIGGIETAEDVLEMIMAGANAVQVGSANFKDPYTMPNIIATLPRIMDLYKIDSITSLIKEIENGK